MQQINSKEIIEEYINITIDGLDKSIIWVVYVLRSFADKDLMYVGCTNNIKRRLRQHNGMIKGGGEYTSENRPWRLALLVPVNNREDALNVEYWAKAKNWKDKSTIPNDNPINRRWYLIKESMKIYNYSKFIVFDQDFTEFVH